MASHFAEIGANGVQFFVFDSAFQQISVKVFESCGHANAELEGLQDLDLLLFEGALGELAVADLLNNGFHEERDDVLVLGSREHGGDAGHVELTGGEAALGLLKVAVHDGYCQEEGLVRALEGCEHLNHPVHHLGAVVGADSVFTEKL